MAKMMIRTGLVRLLSEMVAERQSGTIMLKSQDGHAIMLLVQNGEIISLSHGNHRGTDALPGIIDFEQGICNRSRVAVGHPQSDLPPTAQILEFLGNVDRRGPLESAAGPVETAQAAAAPSAPGDGLDAHLDPGTANRLVENVGKILIEYLGPIAPLLVGNAADAVGGITNAESYRSFLTVLADDISDEGNKAAFLKRTQRIAPL